MGRRPAVPEELLRRPFTLDEARRAGLSAKQLRGASWRRVERGVYAWVGLPDDLVTRLHVLYRRFPEEGAYTALTGVYLYGVDVEPGPLPEVTVPESAGLRVLAGAVLRRAKLAPEEITTRRGLPVTTLPRTLCDVAQRVPLVEAVVIADQALHRGLVGVAELAAWVEGRRGAKGVVKFRRVLELVEPLSESPMETRLRLLLVLAGLPRPEAQVSLTDVDGEFLGRVDLYYPDAQLAIEYDGSTHRDSILKDDRRQNRLLAAGYRLLRFAAADVLGEPGAVVAHVRAGLAGAVAHSLANGRLRWD